MPIVRRRRGVGDFPNRPWVRDNTYGGGDAVVMPDQLIDSGLQEVPQQQVPIRVIPIGGSRFQALGDMTVQGAAVAIGLRLIRGRNPDRVALLLTNNDAINSIRVGDEKCDATHGARVAPGATARLTTTGDIYATSETANAVTISMSEEVI